MAKTSTTLSSAVTVNDTSIVVASATGFAAGSIVVVDQEVMKVRQHYSSGTTIPVLRGRDGTAGAAHPATAMVTVMLASDLPTPLSPQAIVQYHTQKPNVRTSYSTAGAITLPAPGTDATAVLNGTSVLAMTVAAPTADMNGCRLTIVGNGKAAHTVTVAGGLGGNTTNSDVITFNASQQGSVDLVAAGVAWQNVDAVAGAATVAGPGIG